MKGRNPIPCDIQNLMVVRKPYVEFEIFDPTDVLMRRLLLSPLAADPQNLAFLPRESDHYEDYLVTLSGYCTCSTQYPVQYQI